MSDTKPPGPPSGVIPVVEERLVVGRNTVETGRVRVSLSTETVEQVVRETLRGRRAEVERVPLDQEVREAPRTREEDGQIIIPVVEEVLVIEKRLVLKEEIRLRFVETEEVVEQPVERRVQHATIERHAADAADRNLGSGDSTLETGKGVEP